MKTTRRGWTQKEDILLKRLIKRYGIKNWPYICDQFNEKQNQIIRTQVQCKERWVKYLNPAINKKKWQRDQMERIFCQHQQLGNKWTEISAKLGSNRTDSDIKNQFYNALRKGLRRICRHLSIEDSTNKVKSIKGKTLSNLLLNFDKCQISEYIDRSGIYNLLLQFSLEDDAFNQSLQNNEFRSKLKTIVSMFLKEANKATQRQECLNSSCQINKSTPSIDGEMNQQIQIKSYGLIKYIGNLNYNIKNQSQLVKESDEKQINMLNNQINQLDDLNQIMSIQFLDGPHKKLPYQSQHHEFTGNLRNCSNDLINDEGDFYLENQQIQICSAPRSNWLDRAEENVQTNKKRKLRNFGTKSHLSF